MARLSQQALEQYRRQGFVRGGKILSDRELARLREETDRLIAELPAGIRPENMPSVHYRNRYFLDLFLSDPLVDVAEQILGPDVALFTSYVISKRPGDGLEVEWHQDAAFFPIDPMETFTVWLAVDDSDRENGCMRVIPGSHRNKVLLNHRVDRTTKPPCPCPSLRWTRPRRSTWSSKPESFPPTTSSCGTAPTPTVPSGAAAASPSSTFRLVSASIAPLCLPPGSIGPV